MQLLGRQTTAPGDADQTAVQCRLVPPPHLCTLHDLQALDRDGLVLRPVLLALLLLLERLLEPLLGLMLLLLLSFLLLLLL